MNSKTKRGQIHIDKGVWATRIPSICFSYAARHEVSLSRQDAIGNIVCADIDVGPAFSARY